MSRLTLLEIYRALAFHPDLSVCFIFLLLLPHSGPEGSEFIARLVKENFYITELDLGQNKIKSPGAQAIAEVLTDNNTIKTLNLSWNDFKDKDAACLAEGIRVNQTLTWLDLSHNEFAEEAGALFGELSWMNIVPTLTHKGLNRISRSCVTGYE